MNATAEALENESLEFAVERYFESAGTPRGFDQRWVKMKLGPIPFVFPNSPARQAAAHLHDLHHVATGYGTDLLGEAEIGAWELASGCGRHWPAWSLNLSALAIGVLIDRRRTFAAYCRGRRSTNLYREESLLHPELLRERVSSLQSRLRLTGEPPGPTLADRLTFSLWLAASLVYFLGGPLSLLVFHWSLYPVGLPSPQPTNLSFDAAPPENSHASLAARRTQG